MKKFLNFRPILFFAIALIVGGYSFACVYKFDWVVFCLLGILCAGITFAIVLSIRTKKLNVLVRILGLAVIPFVIGGMTVSYYIDKKLVETPRSGQYKFEATVLGGEIKENGELYFTLEDVTISTLDPISPIDYEIDGKLYLSGYSDIDTAVYSGDRISFIGDFNRTYENTITKSSVRANANVGVARNPSDIEVVKTGSGVKYNILKWSKKTLYSHMDNKNADVAYAMVFGDKLSMDDNLKKSYSLTGLSHILAVSGLHVGFLILVFGWLLKRLVKNNWIYSGLLLSVLIFYAYLCGWSPSVIRAVVMCGVLLLSDALNVQYDGLNALSIAGIVNFIISPLNIFDVGFLLSFSVVFSIFALSPQLRVLLRRRVPKSLLSSVTLSVSAWVGSLPILLYYFQNLAPFAVIINILIVPIVGIIFLSVVGCLVLSLLPFAGGFFLAIPNFMISCLNFVVESFSILKGVGLKFGCSYPIMLVGMCAIILASHYIFIKREKLYATTLALSSFGCAVIYSL